MNPIQRLMQRFGNAGAVSNAASELEARRAEVELVDALVARVVARSDTRTTTAA